MKFAIKDKKPTKRTDEDVFMTIFNFLDVYGQIID
jgi:hypothetical protein